MIVSSAHITVSKERDIDQVWRFYQLSASTTAPSAPTVAQGKTFIATTPKPTAIGNWKTTEPDYSTASTYFLYFTELTAFTDGDVSWSLVSKSSAYEAAKQAYNESQTAKTMASNYLSRDETGIMVANLSDGSQTPSTATGRNVRIDDDSVDIRDGQNVLASFGETVQIGEESESHIDITESSIKGTALNGVFFEFNAIADASETSSRFDTVYYGLARNFPITTRYYYLPGTVTGTITLRVYIGSSFYGDFNFASSSNWSRTFNQPLGVPGIYNFFYDKDSQRLRFYNSSYTADGTNIRIYLIYETVIAPTTYSIGSGHAEGNFAIAMNNGTIASKNNQTVIGKFNCEDEEPTEANQKAFIIGNGTASDDRSNALTVDFDGNIHAKGDLYVKCNPDSSGGKSIVDLIYPVGSIYMSVNSTSPATLFGGKWERITGKFLLAATDNGSSGASQAAGREGGSPDAIVPYHRHSVATVSGGISGGGHTHTISIKYAKDAATGTVKNRANETASTGTATSWATIASNTGTHTHNLPAHNTDYAGTSGNATGANMPPYLSVYVWKRTA